MHYHLPSFFFQEETPLLQVFTYLPCQPSLVSYLWRFPPPWFKSLSFLTSAADWSPLQSSWHSLVLPSLDHEHLKGIASAFRAHWVTTVWLVALGYSNSRTGSSLFCTDSPYRGQRTTQSPIFFEAGSLFWFSTMNAGIAGQLRPRDPLSQPLISP